MASRNLTSAVERFVIDIVKIVIKDPGVQVAYKFQALLLLKEISKSNSRRFIEYLDKKLLLRLYKIALSPSPRDCLKEYSKNPSSVESERFYQLLLECFSNWGGMFKDISRNYLKQAQDLSSKRKLPVPKKYWNFPNDAFPANPVTEGSVENDAPPGFNRYGNLSPINTSGLSQRNAGDEVALNAPNFPVQGQRPDPNSRSQNPVERNDANIKEVGLLIRVHCQRIQEVERELRRPAAPDQHKQSKRRC